MKLRTVTSLGTPLRVLVISDGVTGASSGEGGSSEEVEGVPVVVVEGVLGEGEGEVAVDVAVGASENAEEGMMTEGKEVVDVTTGASGNADEEGVGEEENLLGEEEVGSSSARPSSHALSSGLDRLMGD
jgi:hypothetical protein